MNKQSSREIEKLNHLFHSFTNSTEIQAKKNELFLESIEFSDLEIVEYLLDIGAEVNCVDERGDSALITAAAVMEFELVKLLVERGADVNHCGDGGVFPLIFTVGEKEFEIMQYLVRHGADIRLADWDGFTTLLRAVYVMSLDSVRYLEALGADIHCCTTENVSALMLAVDNRDIEMTRYLVEMGVDVHHRDEEGNTALIRAIGKNAIDLVMYLVQSGADVNVCNNNGENCLMKSVEGHLDILKYLVENGANVNHIDRRRYSVLRVATSSVAIDALKYLVEKGADVNQGTNFGNSALLNAVHKNNFDMVKTLVDHGADVNICAEGSSVLMYAVIAEQLTREYFKVKENNTVLKYLVENGADVNFSTTSGNTPLMYATGKGSLDIVKFLIENGAYIDTIPTPNVLGIAITENQWDVLLYLITRADNIESICNYTNLCLLIEKKVDIRIIKMIIETKPSLIHQSLLGIAAMSCNYHVGNYLIDQGSRIDDIIHYKLELEGNNIPTVFIEKLIRFADGITYNSQFLLEPFEFPCLNFTYENGDYILHHVLNNFSARITDEFFSVLIMKGCRLFVKDSQGKYPFEIAREKNLINLSKILLGGEESWGIYVLLDESICKLVQKLAENWNLAPLEYRVRTYDGNTYLLSPSVVTELLFSEILGLFNDFEAELFSYPPDQMTQLLRAYNLYVSTVHQKPYTLSENQSFNILQLLIKLQTLKSQYHSKSSRSGHFKIDECISQPMITNELIYKYHLEPVSDLPENRNMKKRYREEEQDQKSTKRKKITEVAHS